MARAAVPRRESHSGKNVSAATGDGVGLGPGDPELLTLAAVRAIAEADVIAYH
ncbi:SAM-dependent methyltransferase, partial [Streptomyces hydrogenans]